MKNVHQFICFLQESFSKDWITESFFATLKNSLKFYDVHSPGTKDRIFFDATKSYQSNHWEHSRYARHLVDTQSLECNHSNKHENATQIFASKLESWQLIIL